jgi:hypothetical protein
MGRDHQLSTLLMWSSELNTRLAVLYEAVHRTVPPAGRMQLSHALCDAARAAQVRARLLTSSDR